MQNFFLKHWATVVTAKKALCLRTLKKRSRLWLKIHVGIVIALLAWGLERERGQAVSHVRNIQWETCAKAIPTNKVTSVGCVLVDFHPFCFFHRNKPFAVFHRRWLLLSLHVEEYELWNPGNQFCWWNPESWALQNGIQLNEPEIPLTTGYMRRFLELRPEFIFSSLIFELMPAKLQVGYDAKLLSASLNSQICS